MGCIATDLCRTQNRLKLEMTEKVLLRRCANKFSFSNCHIGNTTKTLSVRVKCTLALLFIGLPAFLGSMHRL